MLPARFLVRLLFTAQWQVAQGRRRSCTVDMYNVWKYIRWKSTRSLRHKNTFKQCDFLMCYIFQKIQTKGKALKRNFHWHLFLLPTEIIVCDISDINAQVLKCIYYIYKKIKKNIKYSGTTGILNISNC